MSERLSRCPACQSLDVETVKVHNPETHDMNSDATLRCRSCEHEWEGLVTSPYYEDQMDRGFIL
jgi:hypothetical protein